MNDTLPVAAGDCRQDVGSTLGGTFSDEQLAALWKDLGVTPHPILQLPTAEEVGAFLSTPERKAELLAFLRDRQKRLQLAVADPLIYGFELPPWKPLREVICAKDETYVLGANDSGKTELAGKLAVEVLTGRLTWPGRMPGAPKVLLVAQGEGASKQFQQPSVYKYLPEQYRQQNDMGAHKRETVRKLNYTQAGGFTEGTFVLADGAQCWFKNSEQYKRDATSFEGPAYHLVIIDEPAPLAMVQTLGFRASKVGGKVVFLFTAVNGFDAVCQSVMPGARVVKSLPMNWDWNYRQPQMNADERRLGKEAEKENPPSHLRPSASICGSIIGAPNPEIRFPELDMNEVQVEGCPAGHMPFIMQPLDPSKAVVFTWAHWNPFPPRANFNRFLTRTADKCIGRGKRVAKVRLFGYVDKVADSQFPSFRPEVHVLPHEKIEKMIKEKKLSSWMSDDPRPSRSHFLLWMGCDEFGRKYIYDESPRYEEGEWVTADGAKGDGQTIYAGIGTNGYKRHIRERERGHGIVPIRRTGDPRAFATRAATEDGGQNFFDLFDNPDPKDPKNPETAPLDPPFEGAKVRARISMEIEVINDAFAYDTEKPVSVENEPKLYISARCQNLIRSVINWSPDQGDKSPWKDPIDALRYLFDEPAYFVPESGFEHSQGGSY